MLISYKIKTYKTLNKTKTNLKFMVYSEGTVNITKMVNTSSYSSKMW